MRSRRPRAGGFALVGLWVVASLLSWGAFGLWVISARIGPLPEVPALAPETPSTEEPTLLVIPDRLMRGDTLSSLLQRNGFTPAEVHRVARALSAVTDLRQLRAGDEIEIRYRDDGCVDSIWLDRGALDLVKLTQTDAGWQSEALAVEIERRTVALAGTLKDNLFLSMAGLGEAPPLTIAFANVFAWDFDFHTQSRNGDRFALVVDKLYREGVFIGYGDLRAARYVSYLGGERTFTAFLYEDPTGRRDYYDPDGKSVRKAFLRAPLEFERISSGFSYSRLHPVHKRPMPHLGVDYAARTGTPVYSVAAGVVTDRGYRGGNGNTVTVRHSMGYTSKYLHLSRFAKGLRVGQRVEQKQVIGYVGATGTVTGSHLDFRLYRHGKPVNPLTQIFPPGPPVDEAYRAEFETRVAVLSRHLEAPQVPFVRVTVDD